MKYKFKLLNRHEEMTLGLLGLALALIIWQVVAFLHIVNPIFISSPAEVIKEGYIFFQSGEIYSHLLISLGEFAIGFVLSVIIGVFLGFVFGWYKKSNSLAKPIVYALYVTPIVALFPLLVIWFGVGLISKVMIILLAAVFPILISVTEAVKNIDPGFLRLAKSFKATDLKTLTTVAFPYCFPNIVAGIRIAMPRAITGMVLSEFFLGSWGLGYLISYYAATFQTARFLSVILILILISVLLNLFFDQIEKRLKFGKYKRIA